MNRTPDVFSRSPSMVTLDIPIENLDTERSLTAKLKEDRTTNNKSIDQDPSKVQIVRVHRETKPDPTGNPNITLPQEEESSVRRKDLSHVTVKKSSNSHQTNIDNSDDVDGDKMENRESWTPNNGTASPRQSSSMSKVTQVSVIKLPRQSAVVMNRSRNSAPVETKISCQSSRRNSISVTRLTKSQIPSTTPIIEASKPSVHNVNVTRVDKKLL